MRLLCHVSGGFDSTAVLSVAKESYPDATLEGVFYDYGQPYAEQEYRAARYAASFYGINCLHYHRVPLALCAPEGDASSDYFPYRNLVLTALSINHAVGLGCEAVLVGSKSAFVREGDSHSYRDSTAQFYDQLQQTVREATEPSDQPVRIKMPLSGWSKYEVLERLIEDGVWLSELWSCYQAKKLPCGKCYHCEEVKKALGEERAAQYFRWESE